MNSLPSNSLPSQCRFKRGIGPNQRASAALSRRQQSADRASPSVLPRNRRLTFRSGSDRAIRLVRHHVLRIGEAFVIETMAQDTAYWEWHAQQAPVEGTMRATEEGDRNGEDVLRPI